MIDTINPFFSVIKDECLEKASAILRLNRPATNEDLKDIRKRINDLQGAIEKNNRVESFKKTPENEINFFESEIEELTGHKLLNYFSLNFTNTVGLYCSLSVNSNYVHNKTIKKIIDEKSPLSLNLKDNVHNLIMCAKLCDYTEVNTDDIINFKKAIPTFFFVLSDLDLESFKNEISKKTKKESTFILNLRSDYRKKIREEFYKNNRDFLRKNIQLKGKKNTEHFLREATKLNTKRYQFVKKEKTKLIFEDKLNKNNFSISKTEFTVEFIRSYQANNIA